METYLFIFIVTWALHHLFALVLTEPAGKIAQIVLFAACLFFVLFPGLLPLRA